MMDLAGLMRPSHAKAFVWLDFLAYAERMFSGGGSLLTDPAQYISVYSQGQALLQSDVVSVAMGDVFFAGMLADAPFQATCAGKKPRAVVRRLLAAENPGQTLEEILKALNSLFACGRPLVLVAPSPRQWLTMARAHGLAADADPTPEDVEAVALYLAEAFHRLASLGLSAVVLAEGQKADAGDRSFYRPLYNLARHYRWQLGLMVNEEAGPGSDDVDFVLTRTLNLRQLQAFWQSGALYAGGLTESFWNGQDQMVDGMAAGPFFGAVPRHAQPELVLDRLHGLRASGRSRN